MSIEVHHDFVDNLTGVYAKDFFFEASNYILQLSIRHKIPFSLCIMDVDDLQIINTTYSHGIGNQILESIAQIIIHNCRKSDIITYLGEGKIGILLNNISGVDTQIFLNDLRQKIENHEHVFIERKINVTVSMGVYMVHNYINTNTFNAIYLKALESLDLAIEKGKNRIEVY